METQTVACQALMSSLLGLMSSLHQQESLQALFGLFLAPVGCPLPQHSQLKSAGALSRFLNHCGWPTRKVIRHVRSWVLEQLLGWAPQGRWPQLQLIVDLTTRNFYPSLATAIADSATIKTDVIPGPFLISLISGFQLAALV